jgi:hypothetical protein
LEAAGDPVAFGGVGPLEREGTGEGIQAADGVFDAVGGFLTILPGGVGGELPLGVKLPSGLGFKSVDVAIAAVGGGESAHAVVDADDAVINPSVVAGKLE